MWGCYLSLRDNDAGGCTRGHTLTLFGNRLQVTSSLLV